MGSLTIRIDNEALIKGLEDRAHMSGRTVEAEAEAVLASVVRPAAPDRTDLFARMEALRALTAGTQQTPSEILLRELRDER